MQNVSSALAPATFLVTPGARAALLTLMKAFLILPLVLAMLAAAGCGAYRFPGAGTGSSGSVSGQVTAVPCGPVESPTQPCMGRPASGLEIDFSGDDTMVAAQTDSRGYYSVQLPAGTWKVSFKKFMRIVSGHRR